MGFGGGRENPYPHRESGQASGSCALPDGQMATDRTFFAKCSVSLQFNKKQRIFYSGIYVLFLKTHLT